MVPELDVCRMCEVEGRNIREVRPWPDGRETGSKVHGGENNLGVIKYIYERYRRRTHSGRDESGKDHADVHRRGGDRRHHERRQMRK